MELISLVSSILATLDETSKTFEVYDKSSGLFNDMSGQMQLIPSSPQEPFSLNGKT